MACTTDFVDFVCSHIGDKCKYWIPRNWQNIKSSSNWQNNIYKIKKQL